MTPEPAARGMLSASATSPASPASPLYWPAELSVFSMKVGAIGWSRMRITQTMRIAEKRRLVAGLLAAVCLARDVGGADRAAVERPFGRPPVYQREGTFDRTRSWQQENRLRTRGSDMPYQRRRYASPGPHHRPRPAPPSVSHGAWFQRPYPYHLDYYRLRYGGMYEPYYRGGLYGTPPVVAPPAFGYSYGYGYGYGPRAPSASEGDAPPESPVDP
jgi:hypothetical protein